MVKWLLGFLFGKQAEIFSEKGRVEHDLGQKKWDQWNDRLQKNPDYDWRHHSGRDPEKEKSAN